MNLDQSITWATQQLLKKLQGLIREFLERKKVEYKKAHGGKPKPVLTLRELMNNSAAASFRVVESLPHLAPIKLERDLKMTWTEVVDPKNLWHENFESSPYARVLPQLVTEGKLKVFLDGLRQLLATFQSGAWPHVLAFSDSSLVAMLAYQAVRQYLPAIQVSFVSQTTTKEERQKIYASFNNQDLTVPPERRVQLIVTTYAIGGTGVDLPGGQYIIQLDLPRDGATDVQSRGRVRRVSQTAAEVRVTRLLREAEDGRNLFESTLLRKLKGQDVIQYLVRFGISDGDEDKVVDDIYF